MIKKMTPRGEFQDVPGLTRDNLVKEIGNWFCHPVSRSTALYVFFNLSGTEENTFAGKSLTNFLEVYDDVYFVYIRKGKMETNWDAPSVILGILGNRMSLDETDSPRRLSRGDVVSMGDDFKFTI